MDHTFRGQRQKDRRQGQRIDDHEQRHERLEEKFRRHFAELPAADRKRARQARAGVSADTVPQGPEGSRTNFIRAAYLIDL